MRYFWFKKIFFSLSLRSFLQPGIFCRRSHLRREHQGKNPAAQPRLSPPLSLPDFSALSRSFPSSHRA
jgi:hypothetical protein